MWWRELPQRRIRKLGRMSEHPKRRKGRISWTLRSSSPQKTRLGNKNHIGRSWLEFQGLRELYFDGGTSIPARDGEGRSVGRYMRHLQILHVSQPSEIRRASCRERL